MKRRDFVRTTLAAGAAVLSGAAPSVAAAAGAVNPPRHNFKLKYAPHPGMFKNTVGDDVIAEINYMADVGFRALEDNGMKGRPKELQEKMAATMAKRGMQMGVFVAHDVPWNNSLFATGDKDYRTKFLQEIRESVEVARRVNARWMTVVPGQSDRKLAWDYQTAHVVETLKQASAILEPHGITMVLEPLNPYRDHPGMFLSEIPQTYMICKAVNSPSCKILFDLYHQQITEGNLIPNIDLAYEEVGYFQIGDNPGRKEPTTGEINYTNVFKHIYNKKWDGILGMEHGISRKGKEGEDALIQAYVTVDGFQVS